MAALSWRWKSSTMTFDWGCAVSDYPELVPQIIPQFLFELGASIRGDNGWGPKMSYPSTEEGVNHRFGSYFWPTCESIDTSQ